MATKTKQYKTVNSLMNAYFAGKVTKEEYEKQLDRITNTITNLY